VGRGPRGPGVSGPDALEVGAKLGRPAGVLEDPWLGLQRDAGVDERGATQPAAPEDGAVALDVEVEEPELRADPAARQRGVRRLALPCGLRLGVGELAGLVLAAALQHADLPAGAGQPRPRDAATVAAAAAVRLSVGIERAM
jgi:hypothetical protein